MKTKNSQYKHAISVTADIHLNDTINTWLMVPHFPRGKNNQSRFRLDLVIQWWKEVTFEKVNYC